MTNKYHLKYDTKCPSCSHDSEDINHFLWCPTHCEWKTNMFSRLTQYFSHTSTQPAIADLLQECLHQWLYTDHPAFLNPSPQHTKLMMQQAQIGWDQLFCGRFSMQWSVIQHNYISHLNTTPDSYLAQTWLQGIILIIWDQVHKIGFLGMKINMAMMHRVEKHKNMLKHNVRHQSYTTNDTSSNHATGTCSTQQRMNIFLKK